MKILDPNVYERYPALRIAYFDGKLDICEELQEILHQFLLHNKLSPFQPHDDYERGKMDAINAIVQMVMGLEEGVQNQPVSAQFDA